MIEIQINLKLKRITHIDGQNAVAVFENDMTPPYIKFVVTPYDYFDGLTIGDSYLFTIGKSETKQEFPVINSKTGQVSS